MKRFFDIPQLRMLAACLLWLGLWQAASLVVGNGVLLAGPIETLARLGAIVSGESFMPIVWFSFARIAGGFLVAFALGLVLGVVAHRWPVVRELLAPAVLAVKSIPVACVVVLLLIWVGSASVSAACVGLMAFPAVYLAMLEGLDHADTKVADMLQVFGVPGWRRFCVHVWPSILPYLVATSRNACGMAWKAGVAAELIGTPLGSIGERVYQAKILLETADLFAWTIVIVVLSSLFEHAFVWLLGQSGRASLRLSLAGGGAEVRNAPAPVRMRGVGFAYGAEPVLSSVDLSCEPGEVRLLSGASGTGKSTLLSLLMGLLAPAAGTVEVPSLSVVFQEARLIEALDAVSNVRLVSMGSVTDAEARALLAELLPEELLVRPVRELSGGQRRRVEIVRALAHPSGAVLLDEPFAALDEASHAQSAAFVMKHLAGRPLIVASHNPADRELLQQTPLLSSSRVEVASGS